LSVAWASGVARSSDLDLVVGEQLAGVAYALAARAAPALRASLVEVAAGAADRAATSP
jgi:hypothetical protein